MNRGLSTVQMLQQMYNATNQQPFGSGLTAVTDVSKRIVYIHDDIICFHQPTSIQCRAAHGYLVQPPNIN